MSSLASPPSSEPPAHRPTFLQNVLWIWFGLSAGLVSAFFLSPFIVRQLGDDNYGLWAVTTALVEYYWLLDLGLRSATVRSAAHYSALGQMHELSEVVSVGVFYNLSFIPLLVTGTFLIRGPLSSWFNIQSPLFPQLLVIVVGAWAMTSLLGTATACLEGMQRFDITNKSTFASVLTRLIGTYLLLRSGHGVLALASMTAGAQIMLHFINCLQLWRLSPNLRVSWSNARLSVLKDLLRYGRHSVVSSMGQRILSQSPPLLIAYFLPERFAGYYSNPRQLLDYTTEMVMRVGNVSNSRAAELMAQGRTDTLRRLAVSVNRLSLAAFLPLSIFLAVYGESFLTVWIRKPEFAHQASKVLLALLAGHTLASAGQFSSGSILFGIGKHQRYARTLLVEAALSVAGMCFLIPAYGIAAAAAWNSVLIIANRAILTPWLLTQELNCGFWSFVASINRPLLTVPVVGAALFALRNVMPGTNWPQLFLAGAVTMLVYIPLVYFLIPREDREPIQNGLLGPLRKLRIFSAPVQ